MVAEPKVNRRRWIVSIAVSFLSLTLAIACVAMRRRYGRYWYLFIFRRKPHGIIIHHSASSGYRDGSLLTSADIDVWHEARGWHTEFKGTVYHIGYHYVVLADGTLEQGRPEWMPGAHTKGHNRDIGVCIIGDFSSQDNPDGKLKPARPTDAQLAALRRLVRGLMTRYHLQPEDIHRHSDYSQTACPGDRFPFEEFVESVKDGSDDTSP